MTLQSEIDRSGSFGWTRHSNDRVAARAAALRFVSRVPFLCECDDSCTSIVLLTLAGYRAICGNGDDVLAPGHARRAQEEQGLRHPQLDSRDPAARRA